MSPTELTEALAKNTDRDYILIDTTGRPFTNINQVEELKSFLIEVSRPHDIILVLSSNTKSRDLLQATAYFSPCGYNKLIFTKTDETTTLGSILNVVDKVKLPVTYITNGQNVPDDIVPMDTSSLAKLILRGVDL
jgi:flagellar biosynthesis protein FlhF